MRIKFYSISLCPILLLVACTESLYAYKHSVLSSQFPVTVYGKNISDITKVLYFCDNYISYLQDNWNFKTEKMTPLKIFIDEHSDMNNSKIQHGCIYIKKSDKTITTQAVKAITCLVLSDNLIDKYSNPKIPLFFEEGITGIYLKTKIDPDSIHTHNRILSNEFIPLDLLISINKNLSPDINDIFVLESIYFTEYVASFEKGKQKLLNFIEDFQNDGHTALMRLAISLKFNTIEKLELSFQKKITSKREIYNIVSTDIKISEKKLPFVIEEILIFRYPDPLNKNSMIETSADDITADNLKYIDKSLIEEKIINIKMLSYKNIDRMRAEKYITAFKYLKQGDLKNYYDNLNKAKNGTK